MKTKITYSKRALSNDFNFNVDPVQSYIKILCKHRFRGGGGEQKIDTVKADTSLRSVDHIDIAINLLARPDDGTIIIFFPSKQRVRTHQVHTPTPFFSSTADAF